MNKNIIFLIPSISGGGAERVIVDLSNMFAKNNYNVSIFCIYKKKVEEYKLNKNINVKYLNSIKISHSILKLFYLLLKAKKINCHIKYHPTQLCSFNIQIFN